MGRRVERDITVMWVPREMFDPQRAGVRCRTLFEILAEDPPTDKNSTTEGHSAKAHQSRKKKSGAQYRGVVRVYQTQVAS
jgi:hypothetical protein